MDQGNMEPSPPRPDAGKASLPPTGRSLEMVARGRKVTLATVREGEEYWYVIFRGREFQRPEQALGWYPSSSEGWAEAWSEWRRREPLESLKVQRELADAHSLRLVGGLLASVRSCTYLGGFGTELIDGVEYLLAFTDEGLEVRQAGAVICKTPFGLIRAFEITGRGEMRSGGGFFGGGFGLTAAAEGMLIASALNKWTTKTHMETLIRVEAEGCELFFHHGLQTPQALRMNLSRPIARLADAPSKDKLTGVFDLADQLTKLGDLHEQGVLSDGEFVAAKTRLIEHDQD